LNYDLRLGNLICVALATWELPCDLITFYVVLYNFAVVGIIAIFYQNGIPTIVTQGYLVCTSVILAWNLSKFDEWTCWALLIALAFWDLCAVLTPCGPLKMLVGLMQERNEPLPGLLYEAQLPPPPTQLQAGRGRQQRHAETTTVELASRTQEDLHYPRHTDIGAEREFPMRAGIRNPGALVAESTVERRVQIPSPATLGLGVGIMSLMAKPGADPVQSPMHDNGEELGAPRGVRGIFSAASPTNYQYADVSLSSDSEHAAPVGIAHSATANDTTRRSTGGKYESPAQRALRTRNETRRPPTATDRTVAESKQGSQNPFSFSVKFCLISNVQTIQLS
jgi:hypothetical protein